jgi:hypothetical protein
MSIKRRSVFKKLNISARQQMLALHEKLGSFAEALSVLIIGLLFLGGALFFGIGSSSDWASFFASFLVAAITIYFFRKATYRHTMLIEVTMSYLVEGGKPLFDYLLGKLIAGTWHGEDFKPGNVLFKVIEDTCNGQDWEMKRRIAEALPALSEIDEKRSLRVANILRNDWEPKVWHSDLRRRTVESLVIPVIPNRLPLIYRVKPDLIIPLLRLREKDQVYTAFAVLEALYEWEEIQPKVVSQLRADLIEFSFRTYSKQEKQAIREIASLLSIARNNDSLSVVQRIEQMTKSNNHLVRIAACRNVLRLSDRFPDRTLDVMANCVDPTQHVNVRRPIARERSVELIIRMLGNPTYRPKAESLLFKLISDPDDMVRIPTFDKIDTTFAAT